MHGLLGVTGIHAGNQSTTFPLRALKSPLLSFFQECSVRGAWDHRRVSEESDSACLEQDRESSILKQGPQVFLTIKQRADFCPALLTLKFC